MYTLRRYHGTLEKPGTFGEFFDGSGNALCVTLEPEPPVIPEGIYDCIPHNGDEWQNVWEITNVPGHTAILIHSGNYITNTKGCVLVGQDIDGDAGMITNSRATLDKLRGILPPNFQLKVESI